MQSKIENSKVDVGKPSQRLKADSMLLLVAFIWGSAFVVQRIAALQVGVFFFNGLRFLLAAFFLLPFVLLGSQRSFHSLKRADALAILLPGFLLWAGAGLQQTGLQYTTAGNAGFITGLYVVIIPILLTLSGAQRPRPAIWLAALLAVSGLFLLSTGVKFQLNIGDALELAGAFFWALHVLTIAWLVKRLDVLVLAIGQYLVCSALNLLTGLAFERETIPLIANAWWAIAYTGILSVGLGYTLQIVGQREAPPADAAIILSMEAIFAALFGWMILDEALTPIQLFGCGVMLAGMLLAQVDTIKRQQEAG